MKIFKGWKKRTFLGIGVLVLALLFCFGLNQDGDVKAAEEAGITINGKSVDSSTDYVLTKKVNEVLYTGEYDTTTTKFNWWVGDSSIAKITSGADTKSAILIPAGVGDTTLNLEVITGTMSKTYSCKIWVYSAITADSAVIDASISQAPIIIMELEKDTDGNNIATVELDLIFDAEEPNWSSSDSGVVTVDKDTGKITGIGAGKATITLNYKIDDVAQTPSTIDVYVGPKVTIDPTDIDNFNNPPEELYVHNEDSVDKTLLYPGTAAVTNSVSMLEKLDWVIRAADNQTVLYSTLNNKNADQKVLINSTGLNPYWEIEAEAGTYYLDIATKGCMDSDNLVLKRTGIKIHVYAEPEDVHHTLQVGDSYDIADAFNVSSDEFYKYFTIANEQAGASAFYTPDKTKGVVEAIGQVNSITFDVVLQPGQEKYLDTEKIGNKTTFKVTLTIYEGFYLTTTTVKLPIGESYQLSTNSNRVVNWSSSDEKKVSVDPTTGYITAHQVTGDTPVIITATMTTAEGKIMKATCAVVVVDAITGIIVKPSTEISVAVGGSPQNVKIELESTNSDIVTSNLKWLVSDESIISVKVQPDTMSASVEGLAPGSAVITIVNEDNYVYGYCKVTVKSYITGLKFEKDEVTVPLYYGAYKLNVSYEPKDATSTGLTWKSSNPKVADVPDQDGLVRLYSAGKTTITVVPTENNNLVGAISCVITVTEDASGFSLVDKNLTLDAGTKYELEYNVEASGSDTEISWSLTDTSVATLGKTKTVVKNGEKEKQTITAKAAGVTYIVATTREGLVATCKVTVTQKASGVSVNPTSIKIAVGETYQATATASPTNATDKSFLWTSLNPSVATVDNTGKITGKAPGTTQVTVTPPGGGSPAIIVVNVYSKATGMTFEDTNIEIVKGEKYTLKPIFTPANVTNKDVTYTSLNTAVATVDKDGVIKAIKGGTTVITGVSEDGGHIATCVVTVKERITTLKLDQKNVNLGLGKSLKLKATVTSNSASNPKLKWTTSNKSIVKVNQKGKIKGKKIGIATITVRVTDGSNKKATCKVRVVKGVTSVTLNKRVLNVVVGQTEKLKATVKPTDATVKSVTWTSENPEIAIVEGGEVLGLTIGSTKVTATAKDSSGKKATCYVNVIEEIPATSIVLSAQNLTLTKGQAQQIGYSIVPHNHTDKVYFDSDNPLIASVNGNGKVYARRTGMANITITTTSGKQTTVQVIVIGLNKSKVTMEQYDTEVLYVDGAASGVTWYSSNPSVATVSGGKITARKAGTCTIYAKVNGINLSCVVNVKKIN